MSAHMMSHPRRETLTSPSMSTSVKRKERERERPYPNLDVPKPLPLTTKELAKPSPHHRPASPAPNKATHKLAHNNQLLAGYLAHEFLSKGTLFGQPWDPDKAEALQLKPAAFDDNSIHNNNNKRKGMAAAEPPPRVSKPEDEKRVQKHQRYMEVADLLRSDGAHLPGVLNPTQLARFFQLR